MTILNKIFRCNYCVTANPPPANVLSVQSVDYYIKKNGTAHNTDKFEVMTRDDDSNLVVRRGQSFLLDVAFNRPYSSDADAVSFIFTVNDVEKPSYGHGTLVATVLLDSIDESVSNWSTVIEKQYDNHVVVKVETTSDCVIGKWKIKIDTKHKRSDEFISYVHKSPFYLLFNSWCSKDSVYIEDDDHREEYVLLDSGLIWRGTHNRNRPTIWKYAQYEKDILDCALYLISDIGKVKGKSRGDPIVISRALSAAVNANNDAGVLYGNWSGKYDDGNDPTYWIGSMKILQKYYKSKEPVKYGQCWVFAGVLTTICRAIGLPCRTITNFESAHDSEGSLTIDYVLDKNGEFVSDESIWNFHVWNEVWMQRPDLGTEYSGWQVIDATPQETSEGIYQCGPASLLAIKMGEIQKPYDNAFLFAEVNADKVYWKFESSKPIKLLSKDDKSVGKFISTKAVGNWTREDVTDNYKFPEKTSEEREIMLKALRKSSHHFSRYYLNEQFLKVKFDLELRDDIKIGQNFNVVVVIENNSDEKEYTISGKLRVNTILYTGKIADTVKVHEFNQILKPLGKERIKMDVTFDEYYKKLRDQCDFNISCMATVAETEYEFFAQDNFRVRKPDIKINVKGTPVAGQEMEAEIKLENSLPIHLRGCEFRVEGYGLQKQLKIKLKDNVPPGEYARTNIKFTPPHSGHYTVAAKFVSKEMNDVDGYLDLIVKPKT